MLNVILWLPLVVGLLVMAVPAREARYFAVAGSIATLGLAIGVLIDGNFLGAELKYVVDEAWITELGVRYSLGVDGISIGLIVLTAAAWAAATAWSAIHAPERANVYFLMLGIAETGTLGAFLAQDLLLFVLFFDLMLIPFFFLIGSWGSGERIAATIKMIIYTLVGSLLMLVGAIATAVLAADQVGQISFSLAALRENLLAEGSQDWIFLFFALAFLVKMPAFLVHGWLPDAYRACPLPVLALLSGILSKVAAYGFIRIVFPIYPDATVQFQELVLIIGVASILYGSFMAFTQTNVRLIAGFSSVAQMGFITIGLFSLRADGIDGSVLQMINHGVVTVAIFLIIAVLYERFRTEELTEMGGMAKRAPVLAGLFLVVTMANLAIPGSANFIGEFYILVGVFQSKVALAFIASTGIALAAFYSLRLYQRSMHNRLPDGVESRELSLAQGAVLVPVVAVIVALALWPGGVLERVDDPVASSLAVASGPEGAPTGRTRPTTDTGSPGLSGPALIRRLSAREELRTTRVCLELRDFLSKNNSASLANDFRESCVK